MLRQVEVCAAVDAFHFFETEGHAEFHVAGGVGIVRQLFVVVEAIVLCAEAECLVPSHACLLPLFEPLKLGAGFHEVLHFHLLELSHAEDELSGYDFVAEGFSDLGDAERNLHAAGFLHVEVVHEDALRGFGAQVDGGGAIGGGTHFGLKHEVELTHVCPVACAADGAGYFFVQDDLLEFVEVHLAHCLCEAFVQCAFLGFVLQHAGVGAAELGFVEGFAETLACFGDFFLDFLFVLAYLVFNENVGAVTLLRVAVVDEGVVECVDVARGFPNGGVHEHGAVQSHDVLVEEHHGLPPVLFDVVFEFHTILSVVVHCAETVVDVATGEYETVFFAMGNNFFENVFLSHNIIMCYCLRLQSYGKMWDRQNKTWLSEQKSVKRMCRIAARTVVDGDGWQRNREAQPTFRECCETSSTVLENYVARLAIYIASHEINIARHEIYIASLGIYFLSTINKNKVPLHHFGSGGTLFCVR